MLARIADGQLAAGWEAMRFMSEQSTRVRMGMVGGGPGSFIGPVHRMAAELDGQVELVAGAFSQDAAKSRAGGKQYGVDDDRAYATFAEMFDREKRRADGIEFVTVVTPNHTHLPIARAALESGLHVLSDKPATATLEEAQMLRDVVARTGKLYGLTYTYTGYPLVREAREICLRGDLGTIRKVVVEYSQGWLSERLENTGSKQALWRSDPSQAGLGGCIGDIGVHAFNLLEFVTGNRVAEISAQLSSVVSGRTLDDDCNVLLRLENNVPGLLFASQIATGERNGLHLRVYGEKGGLAWSQEDPNRLVLNGVDGSTRILHGASNSPGVSETQRATFRLPLGHPEGFIEAFANIYRDFARVVRARRADPGAGLDGTLVPTIEAGVRGMSFIKHAVDNSRANSGWLKLP